MIVKTQNILVSWQPICYFISTLSDHSKISHTQLWEETLEVSQL